MTPREANDAIRTVGRVRLSAETPVSGVCPGCESVLVRTAAVRLDLRVTLPAVHNRGCP